MEIKNLISINPPEEVQGTQIAQPFYPQPQQVQQNNNVPNSNDRCWFANMIRRYQDMPNFVNMIKPETIQRSAKERIFREMIRGQINYSDYGQYFLDNKFLENVIIAAQDELNYNITLRDALVFFDFNCPGQQSVINARAKHENLVYVFNVILNKLMEVKFTDNIGALTDIQYVLGSYRNIL